GCSDGIEEIRRSVQIGIFFLIVADAIKRAAAAADDGGLKCKSVGDLLLGVEHDLLCPGIGENLARGAIERKPAVFPIKSAGRDLDLRFSNGFGARGEDGEQREEERTHHVTSPGIEGDAGKKTDGSHPIASMMVFIRE